MPAGIVTKGVIFQALGGNTRKFKRFPARAVPFRLLSVAAGALLFLAALVPRANATVLVYFNFEHPSKGNDPDFFSRTVGPPDFNPGGGLVLTQLETNFQFYAGVSPGLPLNVTVGDSDPNRWALGLGTTPLDNGGYIQFAVDATFFRTMSLSFAVDTAGNGFDVVTLQNSIDGGTTFTDVGTAPIATGGPQIIGFTLPAGADDQPGLVLRLVFDGGQSQGQNLQTVIDNIQLNGIVIPEPTTVAGGLLGVLGLCWHQRRRLIRSVRFRRG